MPGKKKKGKDKGTKDGEDGKLPPPPNITMDKTRDGALEALLKFRYSY